MYEYNFFKTNGNVINSLLATDIFRLTVFYSLQELRSTTDETSI